MEFVGALTNNANVGLITGRNATFRFRNGLTNNGSLMLSFGTSDVSGDITNSATGKIVVAGGAAATFYDDVTQNGTLQVIKVGSTNSVAVFAGAFTGRAAAAEAATSSSSATCGQETVPPRSRSETTWPSAPLQH